MHGQCLLRRLESFTLNQGIKLGSPGEKRPFEAENSLDSMLKLYVD